VHLDVALPQGEPAGRLVQKAVQHLVLGTLAPASHSSDTSMAPFPHTALAAMAPLAATTGGLMGVFDSVRRGAVFEGVAD